MTPQTYKTHEVVTWSGKIYPLSEQEAVHIKQRMEAGAKFITAPDGTALGATIAVSDVKGLSKRQMTMADMLSEQKALPEGERQFNPLGSGYIKFLAESIKLALKGKLEMSKVKSKIREQQKAPVNKELEKMGINYRVQ